MADYAVDETAYVFSKVLNLLMNRIVNFFPF